MVFTAPSTQVTGFKVRADEWNELVNNWLTLFTAGGLLTHEFGGLEFDASAIADGGIVLGTGAGTMAILAAFLTSAGLVKHEFGGIELDISAIVEGGLLVGLSAGNFVIVTVGNDDDVLIADAAATGGVRWGLNPGLQMATGSYTGDGTTSQAITGIGFTVEHLVIIRRSVVASDVFGMRITSDVIIDDNASGLTWNDASNMTSVINAIIALGSDGFTVDDAGADSDPNSSGVVYNFTAWGTG